MTIYALWFAIDRQFKSRGLQSHEPRFFMIGNFAFGWLMSYLYKRKNKLILPIFVHFILNTIPLLAYYAPTHRKPAPTHLQTVFRSQSPNRHDSANGRFGDDLFLLPVPVSDHCYSLALVRYRMGSIGRKLGHFAFFVGVDFTARPAAVCFTDNAY